MESCRSLAIPRTPIPWSPPPVGLLKLNFDGSCMSEVGRAGYGGAISNELGNILRYFAGPLPNGTVIEEELFALWRGILELEKLGVRSSLVEGDSKVVVGWMVGSLCPWQYLDRVERIRQSIASFDFKIAWIPKSANSAAGFSQAGGYFWIQICVILLCNWGFSLLFLLLGFFFFLVY